MMSRNPCRCGALDCSRCHPENFHFGIYITDDPDEFELADEGTLDTVIVGPNRYRQVFGQELAAEYRDPETGALDVERFVREQVLDTADYAEFVRESR